jgi:hypothetical protein
VTEELSGGVKIRELECFGFNRMVRIRELGSDSAKRGLKRRDRRAGGGESVIGVLERRQLIE